MDVRAVVDVELVWGESLVWDDRSQRLYFVDCASSQLHWLDDGRGALHSLVLESMPTGIVPTDDGRLVAVLDDGLHVVEPDNGSHELLAPYPEGFLGRCNDACADLSGNLITGSLNIGPGDGSAWQFSIHTGWRLLDEDISNTNGPAALAAHGASALVIGDTAAQYWGYDYDPDTATAANRWAFGDTTDLQGGPDGSTVASDGSLWCALFGGAQLARFDTSGLVGTIPLPVLNPTDLTFGGPSLDRLYVTTVNGDGDLDGALLEITGLETTGRLEPRFRLAD